MNVVVDASVLVAALVDAGPEGTWAEEIVADGSLFAPELARVETTNVLRRLERAKIITTPEANAAHEDFMQLDLQLFSFEPFALRIWELRHKLTSYDAWYVSLAEALKLPVATLDRRLMKVEGLVCEFLAPARR